MNKTNLCYEISEDAGMAHAGDGSNAKAYIKASFNAKEPLTEDDYTRLHEFIMVKNLADQLEIEEELFKPISYEEYLENSDDDE